MTLRQTEKQSSFPPEADQPLAERQSERTQSKSMSKEVLRNG